MMRAVILAVVLLLGCADAPPPQPNTPPVPNQTIGDTLHKIRSAVEVAGRIIGLICEAQGSQTQLCQTLDSSFKMVSFAMGEADKLYDVYLKTGLGMELVLEAVDQVIASLEALNDQAAQLRGMVSNGDLDSRTRAFATCPGVGSWMVRQQAEPARPPPAPGGAAQSASKAKTR